MPAVTVRTIDSMISGRPKGRKTWTDGPGRPVLEYCPPGFESLDNLGIIHNGQLIRTDVAETFPMFDGDECIFYRKPRLTGILVSIVVSLVLTGILYGVQALTAPSVRSQKKDLEDSETFGFDGIVNTVRPGTRIPLIYGEHRVGGQIIQQYLRQVQGQTNEVVVDPKAAQLSTLLGVCSGEIEGISSLRVDRSDGALLGSSLVFETRPGRNHQSAIAGFTDIRRQVSKDVPVTGPGGAYTTQTEDEVDFFEVLLRFPGGLFRTSDRGQLLRKEVIIRIEYREIGANNFIIQAFPVAQSTRNQFDIAWRSPQLPRANYEIRVTRLTPDDTLATGFSDFSVFAVIEILNDAQTYPGLAQYAVQQLPTSQFSGKTPTYDVLVRGKLCRVFTDLTTFTRVWSANPAWVLLDFLTDPKYGVGAFIDDARIDLQSFLDAAAFCTAEGFECNIVLDGSLSVYDTIRQITTVGRLFFVLRGDKWALRPDQPEDPVQFFSMGRIGKGTFTAAKQSKADRANYFLGEFFNKATDYDFDTLPKEDPTLPVGEEQVEASINLVGSTSIEQTNKLLNYVMLSNRLQRRTVEFEAGVESMAMEAGDVFAISHDVPGWGLSGQIRGIDETGTSVWLDRVVTLESGKEYEVTIFHDTVDGSEAFDVVRVTSTPDTTDRISVSGDWQVIPTPGMDYSFGELTKSYVKYRCTGITRGSALARRKIKGVEYNQDVYGTDLTVLPPPSTSNLPDPLKIPADVTELRVSERQVYAEDGTLSTALDVFFTLPIVAGVRAEVFWRENGFSAWESVGIFTGGYATITQNVRSPGVAYEVAVASISQFGARKTPEDSPWVGILTVGVIRQPDNVTTFRVDRTMEGLVFMWNAIDPVVNFDLDFYELRTGTVWETAIPIGRTRDTVLETSIYSKGSNTYLIKAVNTAGRSSPQAKAVAITVDARINENVVYVRDEAALGFPGTKDAFTVVSGDLVLQTQDAVVAWRNQLQTTSAGGSRYIPGGRQPGFRTSGTYTTPVFEVSGGAAVSALVSYRLEQIQVDAGLYWTAPGIGDLTWESDFAKTRKWSVAEEGKVKITVESRFSTSTSDDAAFGPWAERPTNIRAVVKWAQVRLTVEVFDPAITVEVTAFDISFDVPDVFQSGIATTSAVGSTTVVFAVPFNNPPRVAATIQSAAAGDDPPTVGVPTTTGFSLSVFNAGSRVVRGVEYIARGS